MPAPVYAPVALGAASVHFTDAKLGIDTVREVLYATPIETGAIAVDWTRATEVPVPAADLRPEPETADAEFLELPPAACEPGNYDEWQKLFSRWLSRHLRIELWRHPATKLTSLPGESERDYRARVHDAIREARDAEIAALAKKFASKRETLAGRLSRAEDAAQREQQQASQQKTQTMLSMGAAALGALFGRKAASIGTLGRATTAARGVGRSMKEADDVKRAQAKVDEAREKLAAFDQTMNDELDGIRSKYDGQVDLETVALAPKRGQVHVRFVALGWEPR